MELDFSPVWAGWTDILRGALVTVEVTAAALVLGCVLGLLIGIGRLNSRRRFIYGICTVYVTFDRQKLNGVPRRPNTRLCGP